MVRYLLVMAMIILTPPKGNGGIPLAPKPAVIEARRAGAGQTVIVIGACKRKVLCRS